MYGGLEKTYRFAPTGLLFGSNSLDLNGQTDEKRKLRDGKDVVESNLFSKGLFKGICVLIRDEI